VTTVVENAAAPVAPKLSNAAITTTHAAVNSRLAGDRKQTRMVWSSSIECRYRHAGAYRSLIV
jgi:hypothetical protein